MAIIDYENWYSSLVNRYGLRPNLKGWLESVQEKYELSNIIVFADFSKPGFQNEYDNIEAAATNIIDTRNPNYELGGGKDYTDFILLDYLYQMILSDTCKEKNIVLFSGDGHFSVAIRFLREKAGKNVIVYGVHGCISRLMNDCADEVIEISVDKEQEALAIRNILSYMKTTEGKNPSFLFFYNRTMGVVANIFGWGENTGPIDAALHSLIQFEYIQRPYITATIDGEKVTRRVMKVNWEQVDMDSLSDTGIIPDERRNSFSTLKPA